MTKSRLTIIIGAGHNGLACAAYLAKAGRQVMVLEAGQQIGGLAVTREFTPEYKVSSGAHLLSMLDRQLCKDLGLEANGLELAAQDLGSVALATDGKHLQMNGQNIVGDSLSADDQASYQSFQARMMRFADLLRRLNREPPPRLALEDKKQRRKLLKLAWNMRRLGKKDMREFLRIAGINIFDILEERFDDPLLKGALSLDGVLGTMLGPRSNNSVFTLLQKISGQLDSSHQGYALPRGGMGSVSSALAATAQKYGATIMTSAPVSKIVMEDDRVGGVDLAAGEHIEAPVVISNADPRTTFFDLLGASNLEAGFARQINNVRMKGSSAKLHLALNGLPEFTGLDKELLGSRLLIAPDMEFVELAFNHAKYGEFSEQPVMEISIPTIHDDSLASEGKHVLSAVVQYAPYDLKGGWESGRRRFEDRIMDVLSRYAPGIRSQLVDSELLTPEDIERNFRVTGGHWHHGELALDQALMLRPVPGAAQYASPVPGLYLCGAGAHPGGGVMGHAGRNAARVVLKQEKD